MAWQAIPSPAYMYWLMSPCPVLWEEGTSRVPWFPLLCHSFVDLMYFLYCLSLSVVKSGRTGCSEACTALKGKNWFSPCSAPVSVTFFCNSDNLPRENSVFLLTGVLWISAYPVYGCLGRICSASVAVGSLLSLQKVCKISNGLQSQMQTLQKL